MSLPADQPHDLGGVSCASTASCTAAGWYRHSLYPAAGRAAL